jgi:hypothetical protein
MTEAVLSKVDLPPKDVLANLRNLRAEVRTLGNALGQVKSREDPVLQFEIAQLREALAVLNVSVDRLGNAIDPHRRSDWAIGPDDHRLADESEGLLFQPVRSRIR